jgi:hypothetical protein
VSTTENHSHIHGDDSERHDHGLSEFGYHQTLDRSIGKGLVGGGVAAALGGEVAAEAEHVWVQRRSRPQV